MSDQRVSFDGDLNTEKQETNKGLKLKPKKTRVSRADRQSVLDDLANKTSKELEGHLQEALGLGLEFQRILASRKVPEQKGPMEDSLEREAGRKWQNYIRKTNNDKTKPEGEGSACAFSLVFSSLLKLRDRVNIIGHKHSLLLAENVELKTRLETLENKILEVKLKQESSD